MSQGLNARPHENAHKYPETCEPYEDDEWILWQDDVNCHGDLLRAPPTPTVALPNQEEEQQDSENFSYSGSESDRLDVGGMLMGTLCYGEAISLDGIDDIFPELRFCEFD